MKYDDVKIITVASGRNSKEAIDTFFSDNNLVNLKSIEIERKNSNELWSDSPANNSGD